MGPAARMLLTMCGASTASCRCLVHCTAAGAPLRHYPDLPLRSQGPVAHERDWKHVRELVECWATENTRACWVHLTSEAARPDDTLERDAFAQQATRRTHAAAGLWSITGALAEAGPHILEHSKVKMPSYLGRRLTRDVPSYLPLPMSESLYLARWCSSKAMHMWHTRRQR